jgi:8-oxo-dGTP pyrophosphatase MutT (NUDIX family)
MKTPPIENQNLGSDLPERLARALAGDGRARLAGRRRFEPELSYGRHAGPAPATARPAAVMILLFRRDGRWHMPLTVRPATMRKHGGQISLPGGTVEPDESTCEAALRELGEELGVADAVEPLGQLNDCYVFASNFVVTPWVAATAIRPQWQLDSNEVERVVEMPLDLLLDPQAVGSMTIERGPFVFRAPCYRLEGDYVWGTTCAILGELGEVLRELSPQI